jgi:hypothetical protein
MECAICLNDVELAEEAYLLPTCYHRFHHACIMTWTQHQQQHPEAGQDAKRCLCPLCKRPYSVIIYDCVDRTFK